MTITMMLAMRGFPVSPGSSRDDLKARAFQLRAYRERTRSDERLILKLNSLNLRQFSDGSFMLPK